MTTSIPATHLFKKPGGGAGVEGVKFQDRLEFKTLSPPAAEPGGWRIAVGPG
jgi:hypothetical protein